VRLLLDNNLSPRLVDSLTDLYPDSTHVRALGLQRASDQEIWNHAKAASYVIVSKDSDFHQRSFLYGAPPKVIWIRRGNCRTDEMAELIRRNKLAIDAVDRDLDASFLSLS